MDHTHHHDHPVTGTPDELTTCPVAHVPVNRQEAEAAGRKRTVDDKDYYLCCDDCARQFDADPSKYTDAPAMNHSVNKMAASATVHCLLGCAVGEMIGVTIGTHFGFEPHQTVLLAAILSFISGYSVSTWPLVRSGMKFLEAIKLVFAADTVSILTMTIVDNLVMLLVPGAMNKDLTHPIYWMSRTLSLSAAFVAAWPVNIYLLKRGKGHALAHTHHNHS